MLKQASSEERAREQNFQFFQHLKRQIQRQIATEVDAAIEEQRAAIMQVLRDNSIPPAEFGNYIESIRRNLSDWMRTQALEEYRRKAQEIVAHRGDQQGQSEGTDALRKRKREVARESHDPTGETGEAHESDDEESPRVTL